MLPPFHFIQYLSVKPEKGKIRKTGRRTWGWGGGAGGGVGVGGGSSLTDPGICRPTKGREEKGLKCFAVCARTHTYTALTLYAC